MIFVTGDTHGSLDIHKLNSRSFPIGKTLTKEDFLIITGDFGFVWDNSHEDKYWKNWLRRKPWTTLWVDGNHENFELLNEYPVTTWKNGKVHIINDSIIHLMRGQVFDIDGHKFFTMGGGTSKDKKFRTEGKSWWPQEIPSKEEFDEAVRNLELNHWKVDYVITHTASLKLMEELDYMKENSILNEFFNELHDKLDYKHWYMGHFHYDYDLDSRHTFLYDRIVKLQD